MNESGSDLTWRPSDDDRRELARAMRWADRLILGCVVGVAIAIALGVAGWIHARPLLNGGVRTRAHVLGVSAQNIRVAFTTSRGDIVEAVIPVQSGSDFRSGGTTDIIYDRSHPTHARTVVHWSPPYVFPVSIAVILVLIGLGVWFVGRRWKRKVWRAATEGPSHPMLFSTVDLRGSTILWVRPVWWTLLWDPASPPPSDPMLSFRAGRGVGNPWRYRSAIALGDLAPRGVAVLRAGGTTTWPASRLRRIPKFMLQGVKTRGIRGYKPKPSWEPASDAPLPAEFFDETNRGRALANVSMYGRVILLLALVGVAFWSLQPLFSRHAQCSGFPSLRSSGESVRPLSADAILAALRTMPTPGFAEASDHKFLSSEIVEPNEGYQDGAQVEFVGSGATRLSLEMLQFDSDSAAWRHWQGVWLDVCRFRHKVITLPGSPGARGMSLFAQGGAFDHRVYFVRRGRLYLISTATRDPSARKVLNEASAVIASNV